MGRLKYRVTQTDTSALPIRLVRELSGLPHTTRLDLEILSWLSRRCTSRGLIILSRSFRFLGKSPSPAAGGGGGSPRIAVCTVLQSAVLSRFRRWGPDASLVTVATP